MGNNSSQFNASTTAEQAIRDTDLSGKWAIVTGSSAGIGVETVRVLLKKNCNVVMACRDKDKMAKAAEEILKDVKTSNGKLEQMILDLGSLKSVGDFSAEYKAKNFPCHLLILNAGVMACPQGKTQDGFETQIGTNHFGHFALTMQLLDVLKKSQPARVVVLSSEGHKMGNLDLEDFNYEKRGYGQGWEVYGSSKLANVLFAKELNKRLAEAKLDIKAFSVHPGVIQTELSRHQSGAKFFGPLFSLFMKTIPQGAATTIYCATAPEVEKLGGEYFLDCNHRVVTHAQALDAALAAKLFDESLKLTNTTFLKE